MMHLYFLVFFLTACTLPDAQAFLKQKKAAQRPTSLLSCDSKPQGSPAEPCIRAVIEIQSQSDSEKGEAHNTVALDLSQNKLSQSIDFRPYKKLRELNFSTNSLSEFPTTIYFCKQLTHLILAHNRIKKLPNGVQDLVNLELLDVSHNSLETITEEIGSLKKLTTLDVSCNTHLNAVPITLSQQGTIKYINVSQTNLSKRSINQLIETFGKNSIRT